MSFFIFGLVIVNTLNITVLPKSILYHTVETIVYGSQNVSQNHRYIAEKCSGLLPCESSAKVTVSCSPLQGNREITHTLTHTQ